MTSLYLNPLFKGPSPSTVTVRCWGLGLLPELRGTHQHSCVLLHCVYAYSTSSPHRVSGVPVALAHGLMRPLCPVGLASRCGGPGWRSLHKLGVEGAGSPTSQGPCTLHCALFFPFQLCANALLFLSVNMYGVFVRILAERSQRKAFLQARSCIEDRLRLEDENEKQVDMAGISLQGWEAWSRGHGAGRQQQRQGGVTKGGAGSMGQGGRTLTWEQGARDGWGELRAGRGTQRSICSPQAEQLCCCSLPQLSSQECRHLAALLGVGKFSKPSRAPLYLYK